MALRGRCVQAAEEREFAAKWESERQRRIREEEEKERKRRELNMGLKSEIDTIVEMKRALQADMEAHAKEQDRATLDRWDAERRAIEERERSRKERERQVR